MAKPSVKVVQALGVMAEMNGRALSEAAIYMFATDLADFPEDDVLAALSACRQTLRGFPTVADIIAHIRSSDGRPGADQAWAMIPAGENGSVVWTDEMAEAYGVARSLRDSGEETAARMAFREAYLKLLSDARAARRPTKWTVSLGLDKATHEPVLREAVAKGRITPAQANAFLPERISTNVLRLHGPTAPGEERELSQMDIVAMIANIKKRIQGSDP